MHPPRSKRIKRALQISGLTLLLLPCVSCFGFYAYLYVTKFNPLYDARERMLATPGVLGILEESYREEPFNLTWITLTIDVQGKGVMQLGGLGKSSFAPGGYFLIWQVGDCEVPNSVQPATELANTPFQNYSVQDAVANYDALYTYLRTQGLCR